MGCSKIGQPSLSHQLRKKRLTDGDDLEFLTADADDISNRLAGESPGHRGYEGNRSGFRIGFILSDDTVGLHASVVPAEGHAGSKGDDIKRNRLRDDLRRTDSGSKVAQTPQRICRLS